MIKFIVECFNYYRLIAREKICSLNTALALLNGYYGLKTRRFSVKK